MTHFLAAGGGTLGSASNLVPLIVVGAAVYFLRQRVQVGYIILILLLGIVLASTTIGMDISSFLNVHSNGYL